jgi:hypothetical protein
MNPLQAFAHVGEKLITEQAGTDSTPEDEPASVALLIPHHLMGCVIGKAGSKVKEIQEASGARIKASEEMLPGSTERTMTIIGVPDAIHIAVYHVGQVLQEKGNDSETRGRSVHMIQYRPMGRNEYSGYPPHVPSHHNSRHAQSYYGGYDPYPGDMGSSHMHRPYGMDYEPSTAGGSGMTQAQQIFIPNDMVGTVIGKKGAKIQEIRQASGSHIKIADAAHGSGNERLVTITGTPESNQMAVYLLYSRLESEKARQQS